jgi:hypothetical protein
MSETNPINLSDSQEDDPQPPTKKPKMEPPSTPQQTPKVPKPVAPARAPILPQPIIDIIVDGPPGDTIIKINLATHTAPALPNANAVAPPKKPIFLRVHSLLLRLHSPFFNNHFAKHAAGRIYTEATPMTLPPDWDGAAFLDWCVMVCGMSNIYGTVGAGDATTAAAAAGGGAGGGAGQQQQQKLASGAENRMQRFPRVVALAEKLGCAKAMKQYCAMPLWRFFGPSGEADEEGLNAKGLHVL